MYNLADPDPGSSTPSAPLPIPADVVGLPYLAQLDRTYKKFLDDRRRAAASNAVNDAFFVSKDNVPDFSPSITSFLCTDAALEVFKQGGKDFESMTPSSLARRDFSPATAAGEPRARTNEECLAHAKDFYNYADVEGFRGSPHR